MLIIGMYVGMAIFGLLALVRGRLTLTKNKIVVGIPARALGLLGLTPFPLALAVTAVFMVAKGGLENPDQFARENGGAVVGIQVATVFCVLVFMFVIGFIVAVSPKEAARRERAGRYDEEDDREEDDRPRRRDRDEDEDDRPRRRDRDDRDDYEDPKPRR